MSTPVLSILLPSIHNRQEQFGKLMEELLRQTEGQNVEILPWVTARHSEGGPTVGEKRQRLIHDALGEYTVFIDDDDWIAPDYISSIMEALDSRPDCVGFLEQVEGHGQKPLTSIWSNAYPKWMEGKEAAKTGYDYVRNPFHKTPIRTTFVQQIGFNTTMTFAEDFDFSVRLKHSGLVKTEVFIDKVLYIYRYKYEPHNKKYG